MLRVRHGLGQQVPGGNVPYSDLIVRIVHAVPSCFASRDVLRSIAAAQAFAKRIQPTGTDTDKKQLDDAWFTLDYWRNRLSTETTTQYCVGTTNGQPSTDRDQIIRAITQPYVIASGISSAAQQTQSGAAELVQDLTLIYNPETGFQWPRLPGLPDAIPAWVPWVAGGGLLLWFMSRKAAA